MLSCVAHSLNKWLYVAIWVGRVEVVRWLYAQWSDIEARRFSHSSTVKRKTILHSLDASFAKVEERFEIDLMEVKSTMNDTEQAAIKGKLDKLKAATTSMSTNETDLAAIHGKTACVKYLVQNRNVRCTVSGLYGAIARRHLSVVEFIYKYQRELATWARDDKGSQLLNLLLGRNSAGLTQAFRIGGMGWYSDSRSLLGVLKFFQDERKFRLDTSSLIEAAYHGDLYRGRLICGCKFVERTADAADIAAVRGDLNMLHTLFNEGSVGSRCSTRALDGEAEAGHLAIVQYLHKRGTPCTRRALDLSVRNGHAEVVHTFFSIVETFARHTLCTGPL